MPHLDGLGVLEKLLINSKDYNIGLGHSRWATHGGISKENAARKNFFNLIENKYHIYKFNGTEVSKNDLNI